MQVNENIIFEEKDSKTDRNEKDSRKIFSPQQFRSKIYYALNSFLFFSLIIATYIIPRRILHWVKVIFSDLYFWIAKKDREDTLKNLRHILGENRPREELLKVGKQLFRNYAGYLIDLLKCSRLGDESIKKLFVEIHGEEIINQWRNKGGILLTVHMGNWELAAQYLSTLNRKINMIYHPDFITFVEKFRSHIRGKKNIQEYISLSSPFAFIRLLNTLKNREFIALQGDRIVGGRFIDVPFFKSKASFPIGHIYISKASGTNIIPIFCLMKKDGQYALYIENPVIVDPDDDPYEVQIKIVEVIERYVKENPDQWFTFFPFWHHDEDK